MFSADSCGAFNIEFSDQQIGVKLTGYLFSPGQSDHTLCSFLPVTKLYQYGVAMLSSVLRSNRAVEVNIEIMRAFVRLPQILSSNAKLDVHLALGSQ